MIRRYLLASAIAFAVAGLWAAGPAEAGNLWLTGHDADLHCSNGAQCNHFGIALDFARQDAPDRTKPLLFLDASDLDLTGAEGQATARARNTIEGAGSAFPFVSL